MKGPGLYTLGALQNAHLTQRSTGRGWVPARPTAAPTIRERFRLALGVFFGKYDAVKWPGDQ